MILGPGDEAIDSDTHPLTLPDTPIVMPAGELPVVREGTVGGIPAYEADQPKRPCGCPGNDVCLHGTPAILIGLEPTTRDDYLGIPRDRFIPGVKPKLVKKQVATIAAKKKGRKKHAN